jgi:hypothetical protein
VTPFLSILTPTFRRPQALARLLESVRGQTLAAEVEHLVVPDHVGQGVVGMLTTVPRRYGPALHGDFVVLLGDDDFIPTPDAVEHLKAHVEAAGRPPVVVVRAFKSGLDLPVGPPWPPTCGLIDLACLVVRRDVWLPRTAEYGARYEGDYDFAAALHAAGYEALFVPVVLSVCAEGHGRAEVA